MKDEVQTAELVVLCFWAVFLMGGDMIPIFPSLKVCWMDFSFFLVLSYLETAEGHAGGRTNGFRT